MKIRLLFSIHLLLILFVTVNGDLFAQKKEKHISFSFQHTELRLALNQLVEKYNLPIVYQEKQVLGVNITAKADNVTIARGLTILLQSTPLTWKKTGPQYIIIPKSDRGSGQKNRLNTLKGFVRDVENGETIPYTTVIIEDLFIGDAADENGYYVIPKIPDGSYIVKAMMLGYAPLEKKVVFSGGETVTFDFLLPVSALLGETVIKTADREKFERQIESSAIQLSPRDIHSTPALVEADLFRTLQTLPGVTTQSDFSSALYIRGGNPSENIILLDDVRIYNPYHLGGVFSTFNTDAIKSVDISLGGFPTRYGNAVSSVISVTNRDGNNQQFHGKGSVSLLSSRLLLEGPIPNGSFLISGRRTYFDVLYNTFVRGNVADSDFDFPYYFYDFNGKVNYSFSPNNKITLSGFYGDDILHAEEDVYNYDDRINRFRTTTEVTDIRFGNFSTALKWQYIFNPKLFSEFLFTRSRFRVKYLGDYYDESGRAEDMIQDYSMNGDLTWYMSDKHEVKLGMQYQQLRFKIFLKFNEFKLMDYERQSQFYSSYIQDDWKLSPLFNIQSGMRFTYYNLGDYFRVDPRIGARYRLQDNINLKASFGVYHQYFYTFNPEDIDFLSYLRLLDLWFPIDQRYKPIRAFHYIAGIEYLFNNDEYMFSAEAYYKDYNDLLDLNEMGDKGENDDFLTGWGYATGLEFLLRKQYGKLTGWVGYTLANTRKTIQTARPSNFIAGSTFKKDYITYCPNYDRRHSLTIVAGYKVSEQWQLGSRLTFASGFPETPTIGWKNNYILSDEPFSVTAYPIPVKDEKASQRYPGYFRIDVSVSRDYKFKNWSMQPFFQIINLSNNKNIFMYNYDLEQKFDSVGKPQPATRKGVGMFPFVPTIGVNFEF